MTPEEIKNKLKKNLDDLLLYQSIGVYNRDKIMKLKEERKMLQDICPHIHQKCETDTHNDTYTICLDCGKVLANE